jgi:hypothetical protein
MQNPKPGIIGEVETQAPLGVAEIMVPKLSTASKCTVSPSDCLPIPVLDFKGRTFPGLNSMDA